MNNKIAGIRWSLILAGLCFLFGLVVPVTYAQEPSWSVQMLESGAQHVLLELTLSGFDSEIILQDGVEYRRLHVAKWGSWGQPGQPQLPMHSILLGMPQLGTPDIEIIEAETEAFSGYIVYPVPALVKGGTQETPQLVEAFTLDSNTYSADTFFPGSVTEAAEIGLLREQPVFQLRLYPIQYNPHQQTLQVYRRLKVRVTFPGDNLGAQAALEQDVPVVEQILKDTLFNYDALPRTPAQAAVSPPPISPQDSQAKLKLIVEQDGLYKVTYDDLNSVALPDFMSSNPRNMQLSYQGTPVPILFYGDSDNSFDSGDHFFFYGQGIKSDYTKQNIYWLEISSTQGLRMSEPSVTPGVGNSASYFYDSRHYEEDIEYWEKGNNDHWFWELLTVTGGDIYTFTYSFDLNNITASGADDRLRVMTEGGLSVNHKTQLYLNGAPLLSASEQVWSGQEEKLFDILIPQNFFVEGNNQFQVTNTFSDNISKFYVNWFEITYSDTYVAENNQLTFSVPATGTYNLDITGFTTNTLELFDITNPLSPTRLIDHVIDKPGATYRLNFSINADPGRRYLAQVANLLPAPVIQPDEPSTWKSPANGASYIIITHSDFYTAAQTLATYRTTQGETVAVVKVDDVYDEFNGGIKDPQTIKDFLEYAYANWIPKPVYVVLIGDASVDPKNNSGSSNPDFVPVYYQDTLVLGDTPIDNWYAKINGNDDYPDIILGRIPARFDNDLSVVINKVQAYEQSSPLEAWAQRAVLVADDEVAFGEDMDGVANLLPVGSTAVKIYNYDPNTTIQSEISAGALVFAYSGHGSVNSWGSWPVQGNIYRKSDISDMSNGDKLPFVTVANCLNGYFVSDTNTRSMAEEFLLIANKGGIASWAPSSLGFPSIDTLILEEIYTALFQAGNPTLASAATTARINTHVREPSYPLNLIEAFTFFGDPAVRLKLPPSISMTKSVQMPNKPALPGDLLKYTIVIANSGGAVTNVLITSTIPASTTYVAGSASDGGSETSPGSGVVTWPAITIQAASSITLTFTVSVTHPIADDPPFTNIVQLTSAEELNIQDSSQPDIIISGITEVYLPVIIKDN